MPKTMPFGYSRGYVAQVPAPLSGMTKAPTGYAESATFENGGGLVVNSAGKHAVYSMSFNGDASQLDGLKVFNEFAIGLWGRGLLHFADPMAYDQNLMSPVWAAPHLTEHGWKTPVLGTPTFNAFVPNLYVPYFRACTFSAFTQAASEVPTHPSKIQTILIPPTHKLWLGFKGTKTGTAVVRVQPILRGGALAATQDLSLISPTTNVQLGPTTFDGATYQAVEIYITRTSDAAADVSTITLNASTARLFPRTVSPVLTGRHIPGLGHSGVRFSDEAITETYKMVRGHRKQLSSTLVEVGAWQ